MSSAPPPSLHTHTRRAWARPIHAPAPAPASLPTDRPLSSLQRVRRPGAPTAPRAPHPSLPPTAASSSPLHTRAPLTRPCALAPSHPSPFPVAARTGFTCCGSTASRSSPSAPSRTSRAAPLLRHTPTSPSCPRPPEPAHGWRCATSPSLPPACKTTRRTRHAASSCSSSPSMRRAPASSRLLHRRLDAAAARYDGTAQAGELRVHRRSAVQLRARARGAAGRAAPLDVVVVPRHRDGHALVDAQAQRLGRGACLPTEARHDAQTERHVPEAR